MRIFFAFLLCASYCNAVDQINVVNCLIEKEYFGVSGEESKSCVIKNQKTNREDFIIDNKLDSEGKTFNISFNSQIEFLPENVADSFPDLIYYFGQSCAVKCVNEKHFKGLHELKELYLNDNRIKTIVSDSFKDLAKLEILNLNNNEIKKICPKLFESLINLRRIQLRFNKITTLAKCLFKHNLKLEEIDISGNKIRTLEPATFDHLKELKNIDLMCNTCFSKSYKRECLQDFYRDSKANCSLTTGKNNSQRSTQINVSVIFYLLSFFSLCLFQSGCNNFFTKVFI